MTAAGEATTAETRETDTKSRDDTPQLSARLVAGEERAWAELHERTFDRLLSYLQIAAHGNEEAAREALQMTYVKSVRHIRRFESEGAMWGWLAQIARGCLIDLARRQNRYSALLARLAVEPGAPQELCPRQSALTELLSACLARLAPRDRALLDARYSASQPIAQIAIINGTTPKSVESRLARIRQRLRVWLTSAKNYDH